MVNNKIKKLNNLKSFDDVAKFLKDFREDTLSENITKLLINILLTQARLSYCVFQYTGKMRFFKDFDNGSVRKYVEFSNEDGIIYTKLIAVYSGKLVSHEYKTLLNPGNLIGSISDSNLNYLKENRIHL